MRSTGERRAAGVSFPDPPVKPESVYFVSCTKQGLEMEAVVLRRVGVLENFCPKQGQDFKPSAAPLYPNMGQVPPSPPHRVSYTTKLAVLSAEFCMVF